jgi:hypothetical protein
VTAAGPEASPSPSPLPSPSPDGRWGRRGDAELVKVLLDGATGSPRGPGPPPAEGPTGPRPGHDPADDGQRVAALLGRPPRGDFEVVVRDATGDPVVIRNAPFLADGAPMPTRYWLVGPALRLLVDRLEAGGGVRRAEAEVDPHEVVAAHARYAAERDSQIPAHWTGPRPHGGVAGTRVGVKCLHAHLAWYLAGGDDPVGRWTAAALFPARPEARDALTPPFVEDGAETVR